MKRLIIAISTALSLATTGAFAHGDEHGTSLPGHHAEGHADTLGKPGDPTKASRTIDIEMSDAMRFSPAQLKVKRGQTIRFVLKNTGTVKHEMVLGSMAELKEHAALMQKFPEMEHADPNMVTVQPGQTGELVWQFTKSGTFDFACLQPGHFEAGMKGKIAVGR
ncbi:MAG TPA: cupredoxin family protein [Burkholderiales bacterium]